MLESIIYLSPLIVLLSSIFILMFSEHNEEEHYRCFRFSKFMMLTAFALTVIFYNKPLIEEVTLGNKYTLLFECMMYGGGLALLYLSRKWFASMGVSGYTFCGGIFVALLFGSLLIRSNNLLLSVVCCVFMMMGNYALLKGSSVKKEIKSEKIYMFAMVFCILLLGVSLFILYHYNDSFAYEQIKETLSINTGDVWLFTAVAAVLTVFMFMLGLAPVHFWFTETLGGTVLPVFAYFVMVPIGACWGGFIRFNTEAVGSFAENFYLFYKAIALISISLGALGACSVQNVRKILAYGTVYHWGIVLLVMQSFSINAVNTGVIYILVYLLAMYGICVCLFGLKIKGEYLFMLNEFEGAAYKRPYISAMMTIFIFSLLGIPPFLGFFGVFSALSYLAKHDSFYQFGYIMLMLIVLSYAYVQIIKNLYFEKSKENFDRADSGIYTAVFIIALLMIIIMLKPQYLMQDVYRMIESLFL
ncbi:MAG: hypothetical protein IJ532_04115 [Alphaproteobacteria bacterium]|nr:hypothetical protein [Alphaproteobacteria bacterium]